MLYTSVIHLDYSSVKNASTFDAASSSTWCIIKFSWQYTASIQFQSGYAEAKGRKLHTALFNSGLRSVGYQLREIWQIFGSVVIQNQGHLDCW